MKKKIITTILFGLFCIVTNAQIGYQVALLNSATGKPRANETVEATITITDSKNETVYTVTQQATSNDFGILSFTIGNSDTFKDVAIGRLPLFISVSVNNVLIGKSQILNVPTAEIANTLKSDFTLEELCSKKWYPNYEDKYYYLFNKDGTFIHYSEEDGEICRGKYFIEGNNIYAIETSNNFYSFKDLDLHVLRYINGHLWEKR